MNTSKLLLILLVILPSTCLFAQDLKPCKIDYSPVKSPLIPKPLFLEEGNELKLSAQYLADMRAGVYSTRPSGISHFVYLRPASRKELKELAPSTQYEIVNEEGDVFGLTSTPGSNHFFRPDEHFQGDFRPEWRDPVMVVPLGLNPLDITEYANKRFQVKEHRFNYILLDVEGDYLVFYPGFPETYEVFNSPELQIMLQERKTWGESLIGKHLLILNNASLRYRLSPHGKDLSLPEAHKGIEIFVNSVVVDRSKVLLEYGMDEPLYLVIDEHADFEMLEADCVEKEKALSVARRDGEEMAVNRRLGEIVHSANPIAELNRDEWLQQRLNARFQYSTNRSGHGGQYEYIAFNNRNLDLQPALKVKVNQDGQLMMRSVYVSKDGLYHTRVELEFEGKKLSSERVSSLDPRSRRRQVQGNIVEGIEYLPGGDQGILETIARNYQREIGVRYVALGSIYEEVVLDELYKMAIRDAWLFAQMLQAREALQARQ